jgi:hypothetical protein
MSERISWTLNVQVSGGPKTALSRTIEVHAYDKISVEIPARISESEPGTSDVEVQPAEETSRLRFLLIVATHYAEGLTVAPAEGTPEIPLDGPLLFFSQGVFSLLGESPPQSLTFSNGLETPVTIDILVGRNVTAEES